MTGLTSIDDFVFNVDDNGQIMSSGFLVNSFLFNSGLPPMLILNNQNGGNDKFSSSFDNLAVPAGLYYINCPNKRNSVLNNHYKHDVISDDIYEKLFQYVLNDTKKKKKTKKQLIKIINHKKTKKNKNI